MRFIERMALLVKADAHGVMDQLEERSLLLKQHLREAELELDRKRARIDALADEGKALAQEAQRLAKRVAGLDEDIELALAAGKDELARFSARKLLPARDALAELQGRRDANDAEADALRQILGEQERAFEELKTQVRHEVANARRRDVATSTVSFCDAAVADEEVELELMRRRTAAAEGGQ